MTLLEFNNEYRISLLSRAQEITGLSNPNSPKQLLEWLKERDPSIDSCKKDLVADIIKSTDDEDVREMLLLRQEMAKTSLKKYNAMANAVCDDDRIRGVLMYYGQQDRQLGRAPRASTKPTS